MIEKKKNKGGRPKIEIDYDLVDRLCEIQCTGEEIAFTLKVDYDTLRSRIKDKYNLGFSDYYKKASTYGKISLRRAMFKNALNGNTTMQIWLSKQYLGMVDKQETSIMDMPEIKINVIGNESAA